MLAACLIHGGPHLLNSEYICHLHCLFASIVAVVDTIHIRGTTHVALFLTVAVAWIDLAQTIPFQKGFKPPTKAELSNGNLILREDYQRSFKKLLRWKDTKPFLKADGLGDVYPSYSNDEKERYVCRPSDGDGVHDGYDRRKQAVKKADVFGIEKVWAAVYETSRQHGYFPRKE